MYVYSTRLFPPIESNSLNNGNGNPRMQINHIEVTFFALGIIFFSKAITPIDIIETTKRYRTNQNCPTENPPSAPVKSVNFVKKHRNAKINSRCNQS